MSSATVIRLYKHDFWEYGKAIGGTGVTRRDGWYFWDCWESRLLDRKATSICRGYQISEVRKTKNVY